MEQEKKEIKLKCASCGASLNLEDKKCAYCGTINPNYKPKEYKNVFFETMYNGILIPYREKDTYMEIFKQHYFSVDKKKLEESQREKGGCDFSTTE
jgi:ribosomal protein L37E